MTPRPKRRWRVLAIAAFACAIVLGVSWAVAPRRGLGVLERLREPSVFVELRPAWVVVTVISMTKDETPPPITWDFHDVDRPGGWLPVWQLSSYGPRSPGLSLRAWGMYWIWACAVPLWIPVGACTLAALAFWRIDAAHRRRLRTGLCPACGYDRAGLAASAPCPECGAASAKPTPPAP